MLIDSKIVPHTFIAWPSAVNNFLWRGAGKTSFSRRNAFKSDNETHEK